MTGCNVVGVQFRRAGKIYHFNAKKLLLARGDRVVVETDRGPSLAEVMSIDFFGADQATKLKPVIRMASEKDLAATSKLSEAETMTYITKRIQDLKLDMSVIGIDIQLGGNKVIVFFTAPNRVDFRELVKDLASGLKTRVELKQVGARDEAKQLGGLGICGREFCCSSFLREFVPVSIKMAKNQNLALNPSKVSGGCGRLLCCLTYEDETYKDLKKKLPPRKALVEGPHGDRGIVIKTDILNQWVLIETEAGEQLKYPVKSVTILKGRPDQKPSANVAPAANAGEADGWGDDLDLGDLMADAPPSANNRPSSGPRSADGRRDNNRGRNSDNRSRDNNRGRNSDNRSRDNNQGRDGDNHRDKESNNQEGDGEKKKRRRRRGRKRKGPGPDGGGGGGGASQPPSGGDH